MLQNNHTIIQKKSKIKLSSISFSSICLSIAIFVILILILTDPITYSQSIMRGITTFFKAVFPGLLPFMFLCKILTKLNISALFKPLNNFSLKIFGVDYNGLYAFFMSSISGYPIGSKITSDLYINKQINQSQVLKTAIISSTPGPIFVIGTVGAIMLRNIKFGIIVYISNLISVLLFSIILNAFSKSKSQNQNQMPINEKTSFLNIISSCALDTIKGLLTVAFFISIFSLFIDLLSNLKIFNIISNLISSLSPTLPNLSSIIKGVMSGIIEMTTGIKSLSSNVNSSNLCLVALLTGFSGISIIMQSLTFLNQTNFKTGKFILAKLCHSLISCLICFVICIIIF